MPDSPPDPTPEMPAAAEPRSRKGLHRRRLILESAERCFGRLGYWTTTTAEIAEAAGVTQSAIYRYFPKKRDLFLEALAFRQEAIAEAVAEGIRQPGTTRDRIEHISRATLALARRYPDMARLRVQAVVVAAQDEAVHRAVTGTIDSMIEGHRALIEAAKTDGSLPPTVDSEVLAATFSALATQLYQALVLEHPMEGIADRALPSLLGMIEGRQGD